MSARSWTAPALWRFGKGREINGSVNFGLISGSQEFALICQSAA